jgi:hypothetical protein
VRSAYETTRKLLIAANLDWPTLHGSAPTALAGLLTQQQRAQFLSGLHTTALNKDGTEQNTRTWVSSFAPGSTRAPTPARLDPGASRSRRVPIPARPDPTIPHQQPHIAHVPQFGGRSGFHGRSRGL